MEIKLLLILSSASLVFCGENFVSINFKNHFNAVNERFISYEINVLDLLQLFKEQEAFSNLHLIAPAFVKLQGFSSYLRSEKNADGELDWLLHTLR